jgi:hypothetical protein
MINQSISMNYEDKGILATDIAQQWTIWQNIRQPALDLWDEVNQYIHATDTSQLEGGDLFDHRTHFPIVAEIYEDLQAIMESTIFPHDDWLGWKGYDLEGANKNKKRKILTYLKHIHRLNGFRKNGNKLIDDVLRTGNCFGVVGYTQGDEDATEAYTGPTAGRYSPYDVVFDPTASCFEVSPKILREIKSIGEFKEWTDTLENVLDFDENVVKTILNRRGTNGVANDISNTHKNREYIPAGFGTIEEYYNSGTMEVLWFFGSIYDEQEQKVHKNRMIAVVDRDTVLLDMPQNGQRVFKGGWKDRSNSLWSQGPLEPLVGLNYMINQRENAKNDAIDRFAIPDRMYTGDVEEIYDEVTGQTKYIAPEGGGVQDISPDSTVLTYNNEIGIHVDFMRRGARLPEQIAGFRTAGEKTLGEVQSLNEGAFRGFIRKAGQLERDVFEPMVTAEIQVAKDNFETVLKVMEEDSEGVLTMFELTEEDLKANGQIVPEGSRRFARNLQHQAGLQQISNGALGQMTAKHLDSWNLAQALSELYNFDDFKLFEKYKAISDAVEEQKMTMMAQQEVAQNSAEPTMMELGMEDENTEVL